MNGEPSTFGKVYSRLRELNFTPLDEDSLREDMYRTEIGEVNLDGAIAEWPLKATIRKFARMLQQGINPYTVTYYYFSHDWSVDADESHQFFAVHSDKIVAEDLSFSWLEPKVLSPVKKGDYIWKSHEHFDEAVEAYWYRRFYTETFSWLPGLDSN
jgi:hypothetical protein